MIDPSERLSRADILTEQFRNGQIGPTSYRAALAACGLNATDIQSLVKEHDAANLAALTFRGDRKR